MEGRILARTDVSQLRAGRVQYCVRVYERQNKAKFDERAPKLIPHLRPSFSPQINPVVNLAAKCSLAFSGN
jgi:hypothetical protein